MERTPSAVNQPDAQGYRPLQWACLNNRIAAVTYLLSRGASADAADHTGQTALHWTAVRASVGALEVVLRHVADIGQVAGGADPTTDSAGAGAVADVSPQSMAAVRRLIELGDARGYTAMHVAAQYGHANVIYHLAMRWNLDIDGLDLDDRTPLHWAAYKGFVDATKLLLFLNASPNQKDKEGCTPLHWAGIRGNLEAVNTLLQVRRSPLPRFIVRLGVVMREEWMRIIQSIVFFPPNAGRSPTAHGLWANMWQRFLFSDPCLRASRELWLRDGGAGGREAIRGAGLT